MTLDLDILHAPSADLDQATRAELEALVGSRIIGPARAIGYDLPLVGTTDPLASHQFWQKPDRDWALATPLALDPTRAQFGGTLPAPPAVVQRVIALDKAGARWDEVAVVHELPPEFTPGDPWPQLFPCERPAELISNRDAETAATVALDLLRGAVTGLGTAVAGTLTAATAIAELDPILLVGIRHPEVEVVGWVEVARWGW